MKMRISIMVLVSCMASTQLVFADEIELRVTMRASTAPIGVTIQRDNTVDEIALDPAPTGNVYRISVNRPPTQELASVPYQLVATWSDGKELLYLAFNSMTLGKINIPVLHPIESSDRSTLDSIEALGTDFTSTLERYFRARALHKKWRFDNKQPKTQVALRSAKIWFDASANLAKRTNSYFRLDEEIKTIMDDYEKQAASDSEFRSRYRKYASAGYISATLEQVHAVQYRFVGEIPRLVASQRLDEAQDLNDKAIAALERETPDMRLIVSKRQGVDLDLLKANSAYISTLQENKQEQYKVPE